MFVDMQRCALCVCVKKGRFCAGTFVWDRLLRICGAVERLDHTVHVEWREKKKHCGALRSMRVSF
jgi:hypothetical protein